MAVSQEAGCDRKSYIGNLPIVGNRKDKAIEARLQVLGGYREIPKPLFFINRWKKKRRNRIAVEKGEGYTMEKIKIGFLAAGNIAQTMADTIRHMDSVEAYAVAARDAKRAEEFAKKNGFAKAYGSYEEMLKDSQVELVYIASPHSHHYEHIKLCLEHGKHVLCEKAFTVNAKQAEEVLGMAKEKKLLLTEAIWVRYMPMAKKIQEVVASGIIGEAKTLTANLGYRINHVPRIQEPALAGGALLDVGIYPLNFAAIVFGKEIKSITSAAVMTEKGVDESNSITLIFEDGKIAVLNSTSVAISDRQGIIYGSKGYIIVDNINNFQAIHVFDMDRKEIATYEAPKQITGYEYEVEACVRAIRAKELECEEMPHQETVRMMEQMDAIRKQWSMTYPCE